jgi:NAD(P)-dependent dehydrogenase (short-subunit alcohol dehydrogenase family)
MGGAGPGDWSVAGRLGIGIERAWDGRHRGFERRAIVDADIDALAAQVKTEFDTFDLLFANAGFSIPTPLGSVTEAIYDEMFNLNCFPLDWAFPNLVGDLSHITVHRFCCTIRSMLRISVH